MNRSLGLFFAAAMMITCNAQTAIERSPAGTRYHPKDASPRPAAVKQQAVEYIFPELLVGGEWSSTIRLTNRGTTAIPPTNVYLIDNKGNPMTATFQITGGAIVTDDSFNFKLGVGGILETTFFGTSNTQFGHGLVDGSAIDYTVSGLYAEVAVRNTNAIRPDFEAIFPLEEPAALQYMLFDGRNGLDTLLYLINEATVATGVSVDVVDVNSNILQTFSISMGTLTSQILDLGVQAPATVGIQGTLVIRGATPTSYITATALRINPTDSFTPIRAWVPY